MCDIVVQGVVVVALVRRPGAVIDPCRGNKQGVPWWREWRVTYGVVMRGGGGTWRRPTDVETAEGET